MKCVSTDLLSLVLPPYTNTLLQDTPQQENGYDCGVFTCQFLETLSRGEETFNFTQGDMPYLRRRMIWEIGNARLRDDP
jgi:sentrin-specific protease 1